MVYIMQLTDARPPCLVSTVLVSPVGSIGISHLSLFFFFFFFFFSEWAGWGKGDVGNPQTAQDIHPLIAIFSAKLQSPSSIFTLAPLQKSLTVSWAAVKSRFDMPGY